MKKLIGAFSLVAAIALSSCNDVNFYQLEDHQGAYILNGGGANSSISYYNYEREECTNDYYQIKNNGATLGADATMMAVKRSSEYPKGLAYVAVTGDNSIETINLDGFIDAGNIDAFTQPNDVLIANDTSIYVSYSDNKVSEYDVVNNKVSKTYVFDDQPQKLIASGKYLYVACKGDDAGSNVFVIDMSNKVFVDKVELTYNNPTGMVVDTDRRVWLYYSGNTQGLVRLNREFVTVTLDEGKPNERDTTYITNEPSEFALGDNLGDKPNPLTISTNGRTLYYVYGSLCSNSVYVEDGDDVSKTSIMDGNSEYASEAFNGINFDSRRNRIMALTMGGKLVVLKSNDGIWTDEEVYQIGVNPIMTTFNF